jgi:hypothetical protein
MTETTAPAPSPARRAAAACRKHIGTWTGRLPVQVTVCHGSTRTRTITASALNELNNLAGVVVLFAAMKVVSLFMGTGAAAGYAEMAAAIVTYLAIRRLTVVRAVPASPEGQA